MFTTDNLFFVVLFLVPFAIHILFEKYFSPAPYTEEDSVARICKSLLYGFVIFVFTSTLFSNQYQRFLHQENIFENVNLLVKIVGLNVFVGFLGCCVWWVLYNKFFRWIANKTYYRNKSKRLSYRNLWQSAIYHPERLENLCRDFLIVSISKNGETTYGRVREYSGENNNVRELLLDQCALIKECFEYDSKADEDSIKYFKIMYEYFDFNNDIRVTFYDAKNFIDTFAIE